LFNFYIYDTTLNVPKNGLKHHSLHSLRHTNASLLIACSTDVATVSGRLGHSNPNTTLKVYSHMFAARDVAAAENMAAFAFKCREAV
jgi:integrase